MPRWTISTRCSSACIPGAHIPRTRALKPFLLVIGEDEQQQVHQLLSLSPTASAASRSRGFMRAFPQVGGRMWRLAARFCWGIFMYLSH